jgi:hypothetical protein
MVGRKKVLREVKYVSGKSRAKAMRGAGKSA